MEQKTKQLFELGQVLMTPGAMAVLAAPYAEDFKDFSEHFIASLVVGHYLRRHMAGDWGDVCEEDQKENDFSVEHGYRILSAYELDDEHSIWIITEADRSITTILLPSEY